MNKAFWKLSVRSEFSAAHALRNYGGKCENPHGHNFRVEAVVQGDKPDPDTEILADFSLLKQDLNSVLSGLDHRNLNDTPPFDHLNPSSENLSRHIFRGMAPLAEKRGVRLCSVSVWEKDAQCAAYFEEG
jgi:6-pyruvoyltetrahydropterin/6-carboxytetrahydropterin synthase